MSTSTPTAPGEPNSSPEGHHTMSVATPAAPPRIQAGLLDPKMLLTSLPDAARKLDPRVMAHNPVMFVVEAGAAMSTLLAITGPSFFAWSVVIWLWLTVIFA